MRWCGPPRGRTPGGRNHRARSPGPAGRLPGGRVRLIHAVARSAAWVRLLQPVFIRIDRTWFAAVYSLITSCSAISRLLSPRPRRRMTSTSRRRETPVGTPEGGQLVELAQHPTQAVRAGDRPRLRREPRLAEARSRVQARVTRVPRQRHRHVQGGAHPAVHGQRQVEVVDRPRIPEQGQEVGDRQVGAAQARAGTRLPAGCGTSTA